MYDIFRTIHVAGLVLAILMLIATVAIFFLFDIRRVIGYFTGSTERKAIEEIQSGAEVQKRVSKPTVSYTDDIEGVGQTAKISAQDRYDNIEAGETSLLDEVDTSKVITEKVVRQPLAVNEAYPGFQVEIDITYVHSDEIIRSEQSI